MAIEQQGQQEISGTGKLIAIVEDDPGIIDMLRELLESEGYLRLRVFSDGEDARDQLPNLGANLILLDIGLPNLDGASLYKILRGHNKTKNTPIIVITACRDWELHRMGLRTGFLLRKPFKVQELLFMISALLPEEKGKPD